MDLSEQIKYNIETDPITLNQRNILNYHGTEEENR